jgi:hypothetical protein
MECQTESDIFADMLDRVRDGIIDTAKVAEMYQHYEDGERITITKHDEFTYLTGILRAEGNRKAVWKLCYHYATHPPANPRQFDDSCLKTHARVMEGLLSDINWTKVDEMIKDGFEWSEFWKEYQEWQEPIWWEEKHGETSKLRFSASKILRRRFVKSGRQAE